MSLPESNLESKLLTQNTVVEVPTENLEKVFYVGFALSF